MSPRRRHDAGRPYKRCARRKRVNDRCARLARSLLLDRQRPSLVGRFYIVIIFDLACSHGHRFEGWFASADDFQRQQSAELVSCPICNDVGIARVPSAQVRVAKAAPRDESKPPQPEKRDSENQDAVAGVAPEVLAKLREIVRTTENVGRRFPEEARKIHYNEAPARSIRGQASRDEAQALSDEGIDFAPIPPFLTPDVH